MPRSIGRAFASARRRSIARSSSVQEVDDGLIVNLLLPRGRLLHAAVRVAAAGRAARRAAGGKIRAHLREDCSPRHVPDRIYQVDVHSLHASGKKLEVPVRHILMGMPLAKAADGASVADPRALDFFVRFARQQTDYATRRRLALTTRRVANAK